MYKQQSDEKLTKKFAYAEPSLRFQRERWQVASRGSKQTSHGWISAVWGPSPSLWDVQTAVVSMVSPGPWALQAWPVQAAGDSIQWICSQTIRGSAQCQHCLCRNRVRAAQKKLKREQLGADQASFRVWVSLCALGLVRFPAVLMKTQWQRFWEV